MTPEATMLGSHYDKTGQKMPYMPLASIFIRYLMVALAPHWPPVSCLLWLVVSLKPTPRRSVCLAIFSRASTL
ncbi:putative calpain-10 [Triplophysa rosa]|uniref:Calpain-10 n=1 Tax=Triplophysa rosa TaxID=992332 RepID=A0A9W7WVS5_TRIRA|nr:putative calpain-10 [Triplophysa rosa]